MRKNDMKFRIIYDGSALKEHEIDIRDLAPALISFSSLVDKTAKILYGDQAKIRINVKGNFKPGSFGIDLTFVKSILETLFNSDLDEVKDILEVLGLLAGGGIGLVKFINWLRGRKITKTEDVENGQTRVFTEDGDIIINNTVFNLSQNASVLIDLSGMLSPLRQEGIDTFSISTDEGENREVLINNENHHFFDNLGHDSVLMNEYIMENIELKLIKAAFDAGHSKWQLKLNDHKINAKITDIDFLNQVNSSALRFATGDHLIADLKVTYYMNKHNAKSHSEYEIIKVINFNAAPPPPQQDNLL